MLLWLAYSLCLLTIFLFYWGLFGFLLMLFRKSRLWFVASVIFLSPFAYVLANVGSLLDLMWVLLFTPFCGIAVLMMLFTSWMIRYYCIAFSILAIAHYLFFRNRTSLAIPESHVNYAGFWKKRIHTPKFATTLLGRVFSRAEEGTAFVVKGFEKRWHLFVTIALVGLLATTLVGNSQGKVRNPRYGQVLQFVFADRTDQNKYVAGRYTCFEFASDFMNNAIKAGYNCGLVILYFPDSRSHALNCFNTTDRGLIFVEPQLDAFVTLTAGQPYWNRTQYTPNYDDTITGYRVIWNGSSN